jgi:hypothetical protein
VTGRPEESTGGPINYLDAGEGDVVPCSVDGPPGRAWCRSESGRDTRSIGTLKAVREEAAKWARAQSILPNPGIGGTHTDW